jgi:hypothetical protein
MKVNNFMRRKELEAREESDLLRHQVEKLTSEKNAFTL